MPSVEAVLASTIGPTAVAPTTRTPEVVGAPQGRTTAVRFVGCRGTGTVPTVVPTPARTVRVLRSSRQGRTTFSSVAAAVLARRVQGSPRRLRTTATSLISCMAARLRPTASRTAAPNGRVVIEGLGRRTMGACRPTATHRARRSASVFGAVMANPRRRLAATSTAMPVNLTCRSRSPRSLLRPRASLAVEVRRPSTNDDGTIKERLRGFARPGNGDQSQCKVAKDHVACGCGASLATAAWPFSAFNVRFSGWMPLTILRQIDSFTHEGSGAGT